jgi:RNA polymerase sigma-70 factor, ECF subfamily
MTFQELYDAEFSFVWRSLRRLGVPDADLADALQEVFLIVYRRLPDFEGRSKPSTWLFRIAMGVARDRRRKAHRRHEILGVDVTEIQTQAARQDEELERSQDLSLIEKALSRLQLDQRAVFVLFELEELSGDDIAETLQIPLGTVYSRLRLGRAAFLRAVDLELARRNGSFRSLTEAS